MPSALSISLLYPPAAGQLPADRAAPNEADLGLAAIVCALDPDGRHGRFIAALLAELHPDPQVITYRQDVLDDMLCHAALVEAVGELLPQLGALAGAGRSIWGERIPLVQVAGRLAELDCYVGCVEGLSSALDARGDTLGSAGLRGLRERLAAARAEPEYRTLAAELPELRAQLERAGSVTLGINLNAQLLPESATVLSINGGRFAGKGSLLDRLFGERAAGEAVRGITALYQADEGRPHTPEHALFRDLNRLLERVIGPVAEALARYTRVSCAWLAALEPELAFYLGAARLARDLRAAGLPLCRPTIAPAAERACAISGVYSLDLALRLRAAHGDAGCEAIVPNDVAFGPRAAIFVLTGPNSGGKTTYTRAVGQAQVLCQAGLLVAGRSARISPADAIFTHFATAERLDTAGGRLVEELERLAHIFRQARRESLLLLNEPLASTDPASARALGRDLLAGLRMLGARTILVTHLHDLVEDAQALDWAASEQAIVSLVAGIAAHSGNGAQPAPTYRIAAGQPQTLSYAAELAHRHGLGRAQIARALRERGVVPEDDPPAL